ncbi:XdhC family protein, partial [Mesorhizobium metallidurans]|uniref:XdhC family protein n=1 Tax=Mesorhizobium metallidurans TaxID=489722 RepID=UPI00058FC4EF
MNSKVQSLKDFLAGQGRIALVEVAGTKGSTPREKGAFMLVSASAISGTIGGGQLEYMAIDKARQLLVRSASSSFSSPEIANVDAAPHPPAGTLSPYN